MLCLSFNYVNPENKQCNQKSLHITNASQQGANLGQCQKQITWDVSNSNFMSQPDEAVLRSQFNIPENIRVNTYYVGDADNDIINAFSSQKSPQRPKTHIQCVSRVKLHLPSNHTLETSALLDTGSVLNFVSKSLIEKIGNPTPEGTWCGSIKTVSGIKTISTPFHQLCLMDVKGGVNFIRALEIESIGQSSNLEYSEFMEICSTLRINPRLVQKPS